MVSKFNKNLLFVLATAFFGVNITKAESGDVMNHRLAVKVGGGMNFGETKKNLGKDLKAENLKYQIDGGFEYEYMLNPFIGLGLNIEGGYQSLWKFDLKNESNPADSKSLSFAGFYVNPSLRVLGNFFEEGFLFDEEEEGAEGMKLGAFLDLGGKFNFCTPEYKDLGIDEKNFVKMNMMSLFVAPGVLFELPLGIGAEIRFNCYFWDGLVPAKDGVKEDDNSKDPLFRMGADAKFVYDLANFLA